MKKIFTFSIVIFTLFFHANQSVSGGKWYNFYEEGLELARAGRYAQAIEKFNEALKVKDIDTKQIKTYGMHFIEYFPHREKGICLYHLGQVEISRQELSLSLRQQYSSRAQEYLAKIGGGLVEPPVQPPIEPEIIRNRNDVTTIVAPPPVDTSQPLKMVGERMGIAVLPFQTKGLGEDIGDINIVEQMMTTFYSLNRFKLFERTQLERILEEQQLGMSGIIDANTAAEIGKGIGVDAIVLGSLTRAGSNLAIDARLIDTESAQIITAQDEMSQRTSITELKAMINRLATKIYQDLPLVEGYVIAVAADQLTLDLGSSKGIKKGMKCVIYREGREMIHPITKQSLGKETEELGEVKLVEVYAQYSIGKVITMKTGRFEIGNKVITK